MPAWQPSEELEATMKKAAAALRDHDVPFLLGGSLAAWARGGPGTSHDLDYMIKAEDTDRAVEAVRAAGMRTERPPEAWLVKAWDGDILIDLISYAQGLPITDEVIARGEDRDVLSMGMKVMALEDVVTTKLNALTEQNLEYDTLLQIARTVREQIDWERVRDTAEDSPFARAYFVMLEGLGILPERSTA